MLFDPKTDPYSVQSLIAWLERQAADKEYDFSDPTHCLLGQYFTEKVGTAKPSLDATMACYDTPLGQFYRVALPEGGKLDDTFGNALERAKKLAVIGD